MLPFERAFNDAFGLNFAIVYLTAFISYLLEIYIQPLVGHHPFWERKRNVSIAYVDLFFGYFMQIIQEDQSKVQGGMWWCLTFFGTFQRIGYVWPFNIL